MSEYTPSSIEVLCRYQEWAGGSSTDETRRAEFDRWLAARDRENRAIGWDEGHTHCFHVENPKNEGNPYRGDNQ